MVRKLPALLAALLAAIGAGALAVTMSSGSSHREAPLSSVDPTGDDTDVYAFKAADAPNALTIVANWIPFEDPAGGPNFYRFDDRAAYYVNDGRQTGEALQGSVSAGKDLAVAAAERHASLRADGIEVDATLRSDGEILRLEIASSAATPGELAVKIDPSATSLAGSADDASLTAAGDEVGIQLLAGRHVRVLEFSGSPPIRLELRAEGRVLGQATLTVNAP